MQLAVERVPMHDERTARAHVDRRSFLSTAACGAGALLPLVHRPGALYLGAVAAFPTILFNNVGGGFFFAGTSILIVVGVALDFVKQLEAQLMMRNYEGFLK